MSAELLQVLEKTARMRAAQRRYFKTRSPRMIRESKGLEKGVDAMLLEHLGAETIEVIERELDGLA